MTEKEKTVAACLNEDFSLVAEPYKEIANRLGISEQELFDIADRLYKAGVIRRFGAVVRHNKAGFKANALCVWRVPEIKVDDAGKVMAENPFVTHCYTRRIYCDWQYNLYTMLHAADKEKCLQLIKELAAETGISDYKIFFTVREWKKETLKYSIRQ